MKFTTTQENITHAVQVASRIAKKHISLPLLENVLLEVGDGYVEVAGTNLEIGIRKRIRAKVEKSGSSTVPAKLLSGFLGNIPGENTVSFEERDGQIHIESGRYKADITAVSAEEFPLLPKPQEEGAVKWRVSAERFRDVATKAMVCVAPNDVRLEFSGVYMQFEEQSLTLVSTDGFRLLELVCPDVRSEGFQEGKQVIIPLRAVSEVVHALSREEGDCTITLEDGQVFFDINEELRIVSQLVKGNFPEYTQIIPNSSHTVVDIHVEEVLRSVKLAGVFVSESVSEVLFRINVGEKTLELESRGSGAGKNTSVLDLAFCEGEDQEIVFNPRYAADGFSLLAGEVCRMTLTDASSPAVLGEMGEEKEIRKGLRYILMPIKK